MKAALVCVICLVLAAHAAPMLHNANVSIYKIGYPAAEECGQEVGVQQSNLNPHYFFPIHFGGFKVGNCSEAGYAVFDRNTTVTMKPFPGVTHNLTFELWKK